MTHQGIVIEDPYERKVRKEEVLECMKQDNWKGVLDHFNRPGDKYREPLLVWIRPSVAAIKFIEHALKRLISIIILACNMRLKTTYGYHFDII